MKHYCDELSKKLQGSDFASRTQALNLQRILSDAVARQVQID